MGQLLPGRHRVWQDHLLRMPAGGGCSPDIVQHHALAVVEPEADVPLLPLDQVALQLHRSTPSESCGLQHSASFYGFPGNEAWSSTRHPQ